VAIRWPWGRRRQYTRPFTTGLKVRTALRWMNHRRSYGRVTSSHQQLVRENERVHDCVIACVHGLVKQVRDAWSP
jgi:hypothetical protein